MREIKFRAWHRENKEMVYFNNDKLCNDQYQMQHLAHLMRGDHGDVLMQYTGLKDKNGVEIYEGDVFRAEWSTKPGYTGMIFWNERCKSFEFGDGDFGLPLFEIEDAMIQEEEQLIRYDGAPAGLELLGNIHENPELINP